MTRLVLVSLSPCLLVSPSPLTPHPSPLAHFPRWREHCLAVAWKSLNKRLLLSGRFNMFRLVKLAAYALLGYVLYELVMGISEGQPDQGGGGGGGAGAQRQG